MNTNTESIPHLAHMPTVEETKREISLAIAKMRHELVQLEEYQRVIASIGDKSKDCDLEPVLEDMIVQNTSTESIDSVYKTLSYIQSKKEEEKRIELKKLAEKRRNEAAQEQERKAREPVMRCVAHGTVDDNMSSYPKKSFDDSGELDTDDSFPLYSQYGRYIGATLLAVCSAGIYSIQI